jgi:putative FmdB family regulatory protein
MYECVSFSYKCNKEHTMPIYEFECSACNHIYERVMKVAEACEGLSCPECGATNPKKLIGRTSFHSRERYEEGLARRMSARAAESKQK